MKILVINPGSTSTKVAIYHNDKSVFVKSIPYSVEKLKHFSSTFEQLDMRQKDILKTLEKEGLPFEFDAIVARGGLTKSIPAGTYAINEKMLRDTREAPRQHVCNIASHIAAALAKPLPKCLALIADPVIVDEMIPEARVCGSPLMQRASVWHALNQRATAKRFAKSQGKRYEDLNLIVAHLGGGITIGAHRKGKTIDVNNGLDGEGPFSPERAGTLPSADLIRLCFSGKYTCQQLLDRISGQAGMTAWLGTNNSQEVIRRIAEGDEKARLVMDAMIYHIAKYIAAQGAVLCGQIDAILITGGLAYEEYITSRLRECIGFLAPIHLFPGENELESLAENALSVLRGEQELKNYD
ncbi:butyrate kinase [Alloprevotella sp. OH1205_COT-284]|uniref:butyrate kinase n=1 Tax=Alloprevotella sp. OH1205_COT-284 TaxID=2491043 RepID=UPI000F5D5632|nr:butyrate kinase [Alloprevotella sp. OH1205_COT-284]RRD78500.1 butyrate kinase [Alloprevotella sp. OH1205_COT-284]